MTIRALRLARRSLPVLAALGLPVAAQAMQDQSTRDSRIEAVQIETPAPDPDTRNPAGSAYLDNSRTQTRAPRPTLMQSTSDQISRETGNTPASQITTTAQGGSGMAQLSKADLNATLAQLSAAERRVLLQAIEGTDICDNPPQVPAVIALCQDRLETRSGEFTAAVERPMSAEERLLRGDLETAGLPSVSQVIDRLARTSAASDDFSNQAIASIALAPPPAPPGPAEGEQGETDGLGEQTQALINAIINQLGGGAP